MSDIPIANRDNWETAAQLYTRIAELEAEQDQLQHLLDTTTRLREREIRDLKAERDAAKEGRQFVLETMQEENDGLRKFNAELAAECDNAVTAYNEMKLAYNDIFVLMRKSEVEVTHLTAEKNEAVQEINRLMISWGESLAEVARLTARIAELEDDGNEPGYHLGLWQSMEKIEKAKG